MRFIDTHRELWPVAVMCAVLGFPERTYYAADHSDSAQYTSIRYSDRLAEAGIAASIGSVGDSFDNAMAEALNGTFKAELVHTHGP